MLRHRAVGLCAVNVALGAPLFLNSLQILKDCLKARREVDLHWRTCSHGNIVMIHDVYENTFNGQRCLLVVMEW